MRVGIVREFMVKHTKNDVAISDQIDKEIKTVLHDKLGAELVESVDPMYADDPAVSEHEVHIPRGFRRNPAARSRRNFSGRRRGTDELEFAVPGWDVTTRGLCCRVVHGQGAVVRQADAATHREWPAGESEQPVHNQQISR